MKKNLTELVFILDRSGSMGGLEQDTIGGFNAMLTRQKEQEGEANVTTILFDHEVQLLHDRFPLKAVAPLTEKDYYVRGCTALLDAIGYGVEKMVNMAKVTAEVTHNHPEGVKGARATAAVIFLARTDHSKPEIRQYVEQTFGYDLSRTCDEIRPGYRHVETCQETVPEAIIAFLESVSFEDALRNAVSLGGDSDTLACITGGIAEAFYGMPQELRDETLKRLPEDIREGYELFRWNIGQR